LIVANMATDALGSDDNEVTLLDGTGTHHLPHTSKTEVARLVLQHVAQML
jgi:phosphopantothenoylcysteine decarboxylase/phosphopantothenate--cysteine ligase